MNIWGASVNHEARSLIFYVIGRLWCAKFEWTKCHDYRYTSPVIANFRHKGLEELFIKGSSKSFRPDAARKLIRQLDFLNRAKAVADMNLPGFRFHPLKGDRKGTYAVDVTGNYRLTFQFDGVNATDVDYEDYH